jgi:hypothetical protein
MKAQVQAHRQAVENGTKTNQLFSLRQHFSGKL